MARNKLFPIDGKRSNWLGLWYQKQWHCFTSAAINLAELREYKGNVRIKVVKNRYYKDGENRPNYIFCIMDASGEKCLDVQLEDIPEEQEERLYTYDEVQYAINRAVCDAGGDICYGEYLVTDYL